MSAFLRTNLQLVLSQFSLFPVPCDLSWLSFHRFSVLGVLSCVSLPRCPVLVILFWLSCLGFSFLSFPVFDVLCWLSRSCCPVLAVVSGPFKAVCNVLLKNF
jgi:hypothetical protein